MARRGAGENARYLRAKRYGWANQLAHESTERAQRNALKERLASQDRERKVRAAQASRVKRPKKAERGMDAGTWGRSRI